MISHISKTHKIMKNKINIRPLTKDEANMLHGGFKVVRASAGLTKGNTNTNCDQRLSTGDTNTNCSNCTCGNPPVPIELPNRFECTVVVNP